MDKSKKRLELELKRIVGCLVREYKPEKIIVFGSAVSGRIHEWSDLDIVVIKETQKRFPDRIGEVISLAEPKVPADFLVYTPKEFEEMSQYNYFIKDEVLKKGRVIYG